MRAATPVLPLLLLGLLWGPNAAADASLPAFPTPGQIHRAEESRQAETIAAALRKLPGVVRVEVHVSLPNPAGRPLDQPAGRASAVVSMVTSAASTTPAARRSAGPPTPPDVRRLAAATLAGLEADAVQVLISPEPTAARALTAPLASLGPFQVARESLPALRLLLIATLVANALLSLLLIARVRRGRRRERAS